jgi:uncharacterized protein YbjT (DUF2867 family)
MRILVTGGTGVIGEGLLPPLLAAGHSVRLLTRGARDAVREWSGDVESHAADVTRPDQLLGAVDGCDAVVHITGIVAEEGPDRTFERVNVGGTRNLLLECGRAGLPRFVFISSLAAERGTSDYHASKREAEALVRGYEGEWVILRPGNVYGPGDDVISKLLSMHRTLPAIPVIGAGDHPFQPIWYEDVGKAIARAVEMKLEGGAVYEVAGEEITTPNELLDAFERITGRSPLRVPIPEFLTGISTRLADAAHVPLPINDAQFRMLIEHNVIDPPERNALRRVFEVQPTPLAEGLAILADLQPEQKPSEGVGGMERKRFWVDVTRSQFDAEGLMTQFRLRCTDLMPIEFDTEPGTPQQVEEGVTLTAHLPMRGNVQIRVVEVQPRAVTFATLRGHPLAGVVRFTTEDLDTGGVRFMVSVFARAATMVDWIGMNTVGASAQNATWRTVVQRMGEISGGVASELQEERDTIRGAEAKDAERWIDEIIADRRRTDHAEHVWDS